MSAALGSQWNPQGSPGGFSSDSGIPDANTPRVRPPRPVNRANMSGSVMNTVYDRMYANDPENGPMALSSETLGSGTFRVPA